MNESTVLASKPLIWAFRCLLISLILAPLTFVWTAYFPVEVIKALCIVIPAVASLILYASVALKEKNIVMLPRFVAWSSAAVLLIVLISSLIHAPIGKSLFGQGFEVDTFGFLCSLFIAMYACYLSIIRKPERVLVIYTAAVSVFFLMELLHIARFIFGAGFATLGMLSSLTSTLLGGWYAMASYGMLVMIIISLALIFLPLSRRMKAVYSVLGAFAFVAAFIVNDARAWIIGALVFLGISLCAAFSSKVRPEGGRIGSFLKRISWLPTALFIVSAVIGLYGGMISGGIISKVGAGYSEWRLPWQLTLDVGAATIETSPLFGAGPNRFSQAYIANKPVEANATDAWSIEFNSGFGLIPTLFITEGFLGLVSWIVFLVALCLLGARALKRSREPHANFTLISSFAGAAFLWAMAVVSVPSHAMMLLTFIMTGAFVATAVSSGAVAGWEVPFVGARGRMLPYAIIIVIVAASLIAIVYVKDAVALGYFGSGAKALSVANDPNLAAKDFATALAWDQSDIYWRARAEAGISQAQAIIASTSPTADASTTQAAATKASAAINEAIGFSTRAIQYDPANYYNYVSEARVSALASSIGMTNAYDNTVKAYTAAIQANPKNPLLYLNLSQFQASQNKLPEALQTAGAALQIKGDYLDAVYLVSQIEAAQGNLKDAITAAQVAIQLNPQSPLLYFQLGLLEYNNAAYTDAVKSLEKAMTLQPDYANAGYFLGLSYARLNRTDEAMKVFSALAASNPDNQALNTIISTLQSGKSLFAPATAPAATASKSSKLPLKEKVK